MCFFHLAIVLRSCAPHLTSAIERPGCSGIHCAQQNQHRILMGGRSLRLNAFPLALATGMILSGSALADPAKFDGTWRVQLVAETGLCGSGSSQSLIVQNGSVRAGGSAVGISGQVTSTGAVSLSVQKAGVQGSASGKLSGVSGTGSWTVSSLGC